MGMNKKFRHMALVAVLLILSLFITEFPVRAMDAGVKAITGKAKSIKLLRDSLIATVPPIPAYVPVTAEPTNPVRTQTPAEPTNPADTPNPAEPTNSAGAQVTAEPTNPAGTQVTAEPTNSAGTQVTAEPTNPAGTQVTAEPTNPAGTQVTAEPTNPAGTQVTAEPTNPVGTQVTTEPANPADTPNPAEPTDSADSPNPAESANPVDTPNPTEPTNPTETPIPTDKPNPVETPEPSKTPKPLSKLSKVSGVKLIRYSTNTVKVTWKKGSKAKYYRVYYSKKKTGGFCLAGVTRNTRYLVKKLKNRTTYYFYVQACRKKTPASTDSKPSNKVQIRTKSYSRKIIFAGDSITEGIGYPGQSYPYMNINGKKKVVAYRGLNTVTFHTKRIFNGRTGLQKLISENPYRVYMMLGLNEIHYRSAGDVIAEYKEMIRAIQKSCPNTDIVLCAVSPVTREEKARCPGFWQIPLYNNKLKKLAKTTDTTFFDYTGFLKDSGGYLKPAYAAADGYHWKPPAYAEFGKAVGKFDKSLDK